MKTEVCEVSYSVELTVTEFSAIIALDNKNRENGEAILLTKMRALQAYNIKYNGHFGPYVFYTLHGDDNSIIQREMIQKIVESYVKKGLKLLKNDV